MRRRPGGGRWFLQDGFSKHALLLDGLLIWEGCHCTNLTCADGMVRALERLDGL